MPQKTSFIGLARISLILLETGKLYGFIGVLSGFYQFSLQTTG